MTVDETCSVISHTPLHSGYWLLTLAAPTIASAAQPGQFVHIRIPGLEPTALRRPFSISDAADGKLTILYKTVGRGTAALNAVTPGATLTVLGPLGRKGFPLNPTGTPVLVGGGYGVAPLAFLAAKLPRKGVLLVGGRSAADILATERFTALGWDVRTATMDGSCGTCGLVTVILDAALAEIAARGETPELYACGPDGMLKAVGERAMAANAKGWLSLDKHMVCGIGACLACIQQLRRPDGVTWTGRVCKDGPVFEARTIIW